MGDPYLKRQLTNVTHVPIDEFPPSVRELFSKFDKVGTAARGVLCFRGAAPAPAPALTRADASPRRALRRGGASAGW